VSEEYDEKMSLKALCVHGHFYQPPREDPLTGEIPIEQGAAPYRNWNERIHAECYRPNAELGNFGKISFNVGPTLMNWMYAYDPMTYSRIIAQDRSNVEKYGIGNAMAQPYHHTILPLSSRLDKITQVIWGIADFTHRFGHRPAGMWLPETAVDYETLDVLAEQGILYTLLAPWQAADTRLDTTHPYLVELLSGRKITVFFYDQDLSTRVSFDPGATANADGFVSNIILPKYKADSNEEFYILASDGELYGHHQSFRDKFLAHLVAGASTQRGIDMTYPGRWLKAHSAVNPIIVRDNTSWSCYHGVTRWMGECSCTPGSTWKGPLRRALNQLAASLDWLYMDSLQALSMDPWELRHQYIQVRLGKVSLKDLVINMTGDWTEKTGRNLDRVRLLLDAQFERQRMFTSCGWYFDDFDRIEPRNAVASAAQAVWLVRQATGKDLTDQALSALKFVHSSRTGLRGDTVFLEKLDKAKEKYG
jgi:alpha-amylase/alpha-mannosidase (GH57 family)